MLVADVATKVVAESNVLLPIRLPLGIDLELSHNRGIAFGALTDLPSGVLYVGISALVLILVVAVLRGWPKGSPAAGGLLLGGAVGNLGNRLLSGQVTDFVAVPHFAVFNMADVAITFGTVLLVLSGLRERPDGPDAKGRKLSGTQPLRLPRFRTRVEALTGRLKALWRAARTPLAMTTNSASFLNGNDSRKSEHPVLANDVGDVGYRFSGDPK